MAAPRKSGGGWKALHRPRVGGSNAGSAGITHYTPGLQINILQFTALKIPQFASASPFMKSAKTLDSFVAIPIE